MVESNESPRRTYLAVGGSFLLGLALILAVAYEAIRTAPVRGGLGAYTRLITAANRGDLTSVRSLCTERYLRTHSVRLADEGGVIGIPRGIHKNFDAWQHGPHIWICPTNRHDPPRPIYQMVRDKDGWRFDGLVGQQLADRSILLEP